MSPISLHNGVKESQGQRMDAENKAPVYLEGATSPKGSTQDEGVRPPHDPLSWPKWKRNTQILMIAVHSMVSTFMAAGIVPAYDTFAEMYGVSVHTVTYLTSTQILLLGIAPFVWKPLTTRFGRYHICVLSVLGSFLCNIGGARCTTFGTQMATRVITAWFISPPIAIGSGVVTELCSKDERAQKIGWWTLLTTIGVPAGPFIMGFVVQHIGVEWVFWLFAIINFCQFVAYILFGKETLYPRDLEGNLEPPKAPSFPRSIFPHRIDPRPVTATDFISPMFLCRFPRILVPSLAYAITFAYANIVIVVEMPTAFGKKFNFNAQQIGYQFVAIIIGCVLGEQISGRMSDSFIRLLKRRRGHAAPADRLWLSYIGFATVFAGLLTWGFQLQNATTWNVTPCVGAAIASFGNQILTTTLITFAVDSHKEVSTDIGMFVNICRQIYGFTGPFYLPLMFERFGLGGAAGIFCAIVAGSALVPIIAIQFVATRKP
ncbi:predicted protein [Uncinocarpus reesii 1704]|uniref:Major facilitator superfamily (MFS) profile domain-containing protein n=1 Tax=Uncinocarpus reesii (strain UAMH 1704) TaxID=336963 RepID=C4JHX6_UNCRE|nr:uncharacterized protein UREG_01401 [Uncinocarpus reesii 1704]EEP76552.1 predicted protein [Uncinocarpus reesii 1704]